MDIGLRGIFLTSEHPATTAAFYREVIRLPLEMVGDGESYTWWRLDQNGFQLAIHDAEAFADYTFPPNPASNLTHLYFTISDRDTLLNHLGEHDIEPIAIDDVVITILDPDGRHVMLGTA